MVDSLLEKVFAGCKGTLPGLFMVLGVLMHTAVSAVEIPADGEEDVTRAEALDWSMWMDNSVEVNPLLVGNWQTDALGAIRISPTPIANNTYFVETHERIVPCFQINVRDRHYILIATRASESMEIVPEVYCYSVNGDSLEMERLDDTDVAGIFSSPEAFIHFASTDEIDHLLTPVQFSRI